MNALFDRETLILDGGLATELERRGHDVSSRLWSADILRTAPEAIEQLHYDYFAAGACCAITASYQASYEGFAAIGLSTDETTALLGLSVELARSARDRYRRDHPGDRRRLLVAASVGPYGAISHDGAEYRGDYGLDAEALAAFHAPRLDVLASSGADLLACETIPVLEEARALTGLLAARVHVPAWLSFTSHDGLHTAHGEPLVECARLVDGFTNVIAVGVNCLRPELVGDAIRALRAGTHKPIVVYPNSGEQWDGKTHAWEGSANHEGLAAMAPQWVQAGAQLVGGCCRVAPEEIAAIASSVMNRRHAIRDAGDADLAQIRHLLDRNALPTADLEESRPWLVVAQDGSAVAGCGGLEIFGTTGLLRSLVVDDRWRGTGLGRAIVQHLENFARARKVTELVLLTTTAAAFFEGIGFADIARERVPEAVRQSAEFSALCPQSARCMRKRLVR